MKTIFGHGSGQLANSCDKVLSEIEYKNECLTPDLRDILKGDVYKRQLLLCFDN